MEWYWVKGMVANWYWWNDDVSSVASFHSKFGYAFSLVLEPEIGLARMLDKSNGSMWMIG